MSPPYHPLFTFCYIGVCFEEVDDCVDVELFYWQRLKNTESDRLPVQVNAYLDNVIDVQLLLEDSDMKSAALLRVEELSDILSHVSSSCVRWCYLTAKVVA